MKEVGRSRIIQEIAHLNFGCTGIVGQEMSSARSASSSVVGEAGDADVGRLGAACLDLLSRDSYANDMCRMSKLKVMP